MSFRYDITQEQTEPLPLKMIIDIVNSQWKCCDEVKPMKLDDEISLASSQMQRDREKVTYY
jgi:hypothetical protein